MCALECPARKHRIEKGAFSIKFGEDAHLGLLVERQIEKSGANLTRVQVLGAARDFSPRVNFQCRLFYRVRTTPVCKHASTCVRTFKKKQKLAPIQLLGPEKNCTHR